MNNCSSDNFFKIHFSPHTSDLHVIKNTHTEEKKLIFWFNPLKPELNPSKQHCLPEFFTGAFKMLMLTLRRKKAYLIDFS